MPSRFPAGKRYDVFISFADEDILAASLVCAALEYAGLRCWIALRDVPAGTDWVVAVTDAIAHASCVVLLLSQHANSSIQVKRELEWGVSCRTRFLPLRLEDVEPHPSLAFCLGTETWLDAFPPPLLGHLPALVGTANRVLARREQAASLRIWLGRAFRR